MKLSPQAHKTVRALVDFGGLIAFVATFAWLRVQGTLPAPEALVQATWALLAGSVAGLVLGLVVERRIAPLPLIGGIGALIAGGLTVFLHDVRFVKMKPTVMNLGLCALLLGGLALKKNPLKFLLGSSFQMPDEGWRKLTLRYGLFFAGVALLNEAVWRTQSDDVWVAFRFPGLMILTVIFSFTQVPLMMKYAKRDEPPPPHVE